MSSSEKRVWNLENAHTHTCTHFWRHAGNARQLSCFQPASFSPGVERHTLTWVCVCAWLYVQLRNACSEASAHLLRNGWMYMSAVRIHVNLLDIFWALNSRLFSSTSHNHNFYLWPCRLSWRSEFKDCCGRNGDPGTRVCVLESQDQKLTSGDPIRLPFFSTLMQH